MSKPLSDKQAQACEQATQPTCKCRCGGALHGTKRGGTNADGTLDRAFFEALPEDDPHYLPSAEKVTAQKRLRKERARLMRLIGQCEAMGPEWSTEHYRKELAVLDGLPESRRAAKLEAR